jgi:LmbE family N-acetylglucosaminyl deacetylase
LRDVDGLFGRLIRDWQADIIISHRPNDYHPDHRYVGVLVMDAAYMVTVPYFCPDIPHLTKNPVFLFAEDEFQRPNPFTPDLVVSIDDVVEKKLAAVEALESQFYEGGCNGGPQLVPNPADTSAVAARKKAVREEWAGFFSATANRSRRLGQHYGEERAEKLIAGHSDLRVWRKPDKEELAALSVF